VLSRLGCALSKTGCGLSTGFRHEGLAVEGRSGEGEAIANLVACAGGIEEGFEEQEFFCGEGGELDVAAGAAFEFAECVVPGAALGACEGDVGGDRGGLRQ
jgi:hypothetical protein